MLLLTVLLIMRMTMMFAAEAKLLYILTISDIDDDDD